MAESKNFEDQILKVRIIFYRNAKGTYVPETDTSDFYIRLEPYIPLNKSNLTVGIYTLAKLNKLLMPHAGRKIVGFDFFENKRDKKLKKRQDAQILEWHGKKWEGREIILKNLSALGIHNVELVAGNVIKTTADYAKTNLGFRIAMLYLDVDNYEGTLAILKNLFPLVTPGGLVVFDEYAIRGHGESDAVNEYFQGRNPKLNTLPWTNTPTAYLIKEKF